MNILRPDSPVMNFLSTVADLIILNLLCLICCIPIVTIGAAYTAKYYVAMKIVRGEGTGVIIPFFKSFASNFKQATIIWIIQLIAIAVIVIDWLFTVSNGWSETVFAFKLGIILISAFVLMLTICIFPALARYKMTLPQSYKMALTLSIIRFIPLMLIVLLFAVSVIACIWYAQWFPIIYIFCSCTITYFVSLVFIKQFDKLEKAQADKIKALQEQVDYNPEVDAVGNVSIASAKKDVKELEEELNKEEEKKEDKSGNKFTRFFRTEKEKLIDLNNKQKLEYFAQYYLPVVLLIIGLLVAVVWYSIDIYKSNMLVAKGGLINCQISDEGKDYLTTDFLAWGGYKKSRTAVIMDSDEFDIQTDIDFEESYLDLTLRAAIMTGEVDYLILREDAIDKYGTTDYFQDVSAIAASDKFTEEDYYYYVMTEEEIAKSKQGKSLNDLFSSGEKSYDPVPIALKLSDEVEKKLGLNEQYTYYIAFANSIGASKNDDYAKLISYLFDL